MAIMTLAAVYSNEGGFGNGASLGGDHKHSPAPLRMTASLYAIATRSSARYSQSWTLDTGQGWSASSRARAFLVSAISLMATAACARVAHNWMALSSTARWRHGLSMSDHFSVSLAACHWRVARRAAAGEHDVGRVYCSRLGMVVCCGPVVVAGEAEGVVWQVEDKDHSA